MVMHLKTQCKHGGMCVANNLVFAVTKLIRANNLSILATISFMKGILYQPTCFTVPYQMYFYLQVRTTADAHGTSMTMTMTMQNES